MNAPNNTQDAMAAFSPAHGSAAEVESEVCSSCDGYGSISYNPNLNPNAFPAMASAKCTHCGGTGCVEQAKPQPNYMFYGAVADVPGLDGIPYPFGEDFIPCATEIENLARAAALITAEIARLQRLGKK